MEVPLYGPPTLARTAIRWPRHEPTGGLTRAQRETIDAHLAEGGSVPSAASAAGTGVVVVWAWLYDVLDLDRRISPLIV